ncbi:hypothetical protein WJX74_005700 [Apatococcus lobatus]|uniref:Metallo-beta-lactamase domain-containing protein n=1 Tax=Apatococcus lobatus TaxID=904363 RepID=A0AAW1QXY1_9CHLO
MSSAGALHLSSALASSKKVVKRPLQTAASRVSALVAQERKLRDPREENAPGDFYVDSTCIDCDTCRWMAPETYSRINQQSAVHLQPQSPEERKRALQALLACPSFSIHAKHKKSEEMGAALNEMPLHVSGTENVFHLVMASESSYGAVAYLIRRPEGNIMMDSPRFDVKLLKRIQAMGGVKYMCLSHRDDVCDHAKWAKALGCTRILRRDECNKEQGTNEVEVKLEGQGPWGLPDGSTDIELIHTPGHTTGHVVLLYKPERTLFSGDHWGYSGREQCGSLFRRVNWYSIDHQMESLAKLRPLDFVHVLPGHGRRMSFGDKAAKDEYIDLTIAATKKDIAADGTGHNVFKDAPQPLSTTN